MGWWEAEGDGRVGDEILDDLDDVLELVRSALHEDIGGEPTVADMSAVLSTALGTLLGEPVEVGIELTPTNRRRRKRPAPRPTGVEPRAGDLLTLVLGDGRHGLARVLRVDTGDYLVEAIEGVYAAPPTLRDIATLAPLGSRGGGRDERLFTVLVVEPPPASATVLGTVPPTSAERRREASELQDWDGVGAAILEDWRSRQGDA